MRLVRLSWALAGAPLLPSSPVVAQTAPAPTTAGMSTHSQMVTKTKTTKTSVPVQRTAKSLDCSKQADAKNVHGKARKSFMSSCKKA